MVARGDRLHTSVRLPAVPRGLRHRLRLGARRELPRLSGPALHVHTGAYQRIIISWVHVYTSTRLAKRIQAHLAFGLWLRARPWRPTNVVPFFIVTTFVHI